MCRTVAKFGIEKRWKFEANFRTWITILRRFSPTFRFSKCEPCLRDHLSSLIVSCIGIYKSQLVNKSRWQHTLVKWAAKQNPKWRWKKKNTNRGQNFNLALISYDTWNTFVAMRAVGTDSIQRSRATITHQEKRRWNLFQLFPCIDLLKFFVRWPSRWVEQGELSNKTNIQKLRKKIDCILETNIFPRYYHIRLVTRDLERGNALDFFLGGGHFDLMAVLYSNLNSPSFFLSLPFNRTLWLSFPYNMNIYNQLLASVTVRIMPAVKQRRNHYSCNHAEQLNQLLSGR